MPLLFSNSPSKNHLSASLPLDRAQTLESDTLLFPTQPDHFPHSILCTLYRPFSGKFSLSPAQPATWPSLHQIRPCPGSLSPILATQDPGQESRGLYIWCCGLSHIPPVLSAPHFCNLGTPSYRPPGHRPSSSELREQVQSHSKCCVWRRLRQERASSIGRSRKPGSEAGSVSRSSRGRSPPTPGFNPSSDTEGLLPSPAPLSSLVKRQ